ncbi:MAG: hypothetical protein BJ554DRAFT_6111, partial [Olpidium bornovanus]
DNLRLPQIRAFRALSLWGSTSLPLSGQFLLAQKKNHEKNDAARCGSATFAAGSRAPAVPLPCRCGKRPPVGSAVLLGTTLAARPSAFGPVVSRARPPPRPFSAARARRPHFPPAGPPMPLLPPAAAASGHTTGAPEPRERCPPAPQGALPAPSRPPDRRRLRRLRARGEFSSGSGKVRWRQLMMRSLGPAFATPLLKKRKEGRKKAVLLETGGLASRGALQFCPRPIEQTHIPPAIFCFAGDRNLSNAESGGAASENTPRGKEDYTVGFVLDARPELPLPPTVELLRRPTGGPGAGKGTQCEKLVENIGFLHVCGASLS